MTKLLSMPAKRSLLLLFLTVLSIVSYAQATFDKQWKKIDSLINQNGQVKSALTEVTALYGKARTAGNNPQLIKALIYRAALTEQLTDNNSHPAFTLLEKEIATAAAPAKSILQSILATAYRNYLQRNRYRFYSRTTTVNFVKDDPATWSIGELNQKISALYLQSLGDAALLQKTALEQYDQIIEKGNSRRLRPTLFDLLANRALEYFQNDERNVTRPSYAFELNDGLAFAEAPTFSSHRFQSKDSSSLHFQALVVLQQLIGMHLNDRSPDALIDADINRLTFIHSNFTGEHKEDLYKAALENIINRYSTNPVAAQALFLLADTYATTARTYDALRDTSGRYAYLKAKALCEQALLNKDSSEGKANCANLLKEITRASIKTTGEQVNVPGKSFRMLITYRNVATGYFRIVKLDAAVRQKLQTDRYNDNIWQDLVKLASVNTFQSQFPDTKDFQTHRVEIKVDALTPGSYALIASANKDFSLHENVLALQYFNVSDVAYLNKGTNYYVVNRQTGAPLAGATVQTWRKQYDYRTGKSSLYKDSYRKTDQSGYFKLKDSITDRRGLSKLLDISYGTDRLFLDEEINSYYYEGAQTGAMQKSQTFLFTDRSIYRPGQLLYFKGIVVVKNKLGVPGVAAKQSTIVKLFDANSQPVDSVALTTNEFGSYSGKFMLPQGQLNGSFFIHDDLTDGFASFRVEEYKRPKFAVDIHKPEGTHRLGDTVSITGSAKAFAGNNIDGANVTYHVLRKMVMPYFSAYVKIWPPYGASQMEIAQGTTHTDANGKFVLSFRAIPDRKLDSSQDAVFNYEVSAEVTDINGETQTGSTTVQVGYRTLNIAADIPASLHTDSLDKIIVRTTNMSGIFEKALVKISIHRLLAPSKVFRSRYWEQPDQFVMSRPEYYAQFPLDLYSDEMDMSKWPLQQKVFESTAQTSTDSAFRIKDKFQPGWYSIDISTTDKFNATVKEKRYLRLYNDKLSSPFATAEITTNKAEAEPGDQLAYRLLTNVDSVYVIHEKITKNGEERTVTYTSGKPFAGNVVVAESDRGTIAVNMFFVKDNRQYSQNKTISIPYFNKELVIQYLTFRDKTLPGSPEKWKVKISGKKAGSVTAELLTSMYDASLDQFAPHSWAMPQLWNTSMETAAWAGNNNFQRSDSYEREFQTADYYSFEKTYDELRTVNGSSATVLMRSASGVAVAASAPQMKKSGYANDNAVAEESKVADTLANAGGAAPAVQPRSNLRETAFFFPDLKTDSAGNIEFNFVAPEALTTWKWMLLAHTKDLAMGAGEKTIITQKQLMVQPNMPRFLREGDRIELSAKIVNLSSRSISGMVTIQLINALTGKSEDAAFENPAKGRQFDVAAGQSAPATFTIAVPKHFTDPVLIRTAASSGNLSDGEELAIPVVSNKMLVTETLPIALRHGGEKRFSFDRLLKSANSSTLQQNGLAVEFTSNPAWFAVQALPYLAEGDHENAEQVFNRYYANALATYIAGKSPRFMEIIERWKTSDTAALLSNLQKNEELKSVLLQETPWVLEAKTEAQQKRNIALLFNLQRMSAESAAALSKLKDMQAPTGGFVWFKGGPEDRYMTQYILSGIGHLKKSAAPVKNNALEQMTAQAIGYLDRQVKKDYEQLKKWNRTLPQGSVDPIIAQYLYTRSFFLETGVPGDVFAAYNYYRNQSKTAWVKQGSYLRGMIALALQRTGDVQNASKIVRALRESAISNEELGEYWKDLSQGYYWYQSPVEAQSLLIEAFSEVTKDTAFIDGLKTWLLKNKQTNNWKTSRATADACYALLLQGSNWTSTESAVQITLDDKKIIPAKTEAGDGYFKEYIPAAEVKPSMGNVTISSTATAPSWGSIYWQYFEDLDKITPASTPLQLSKQLFLEKNTDGGPVLTALSGNKVHVGDRVRVRIELRSDRAMEYVHLKDMRASCMEPVNVLSEYKWQDGLGYYQSTRDASTDFFFSSLPKGVYVFEYSLYVTAAGSFSNGISSLQCMYAPEFTSHSEGVTLQSQAK